MWLLMVLTLIVNEAGLATDIAVEKKFSFGDHVACRQVAYQYNNLAQSASWKKGKQKAFCVRDAELAKQLENILGQMDSLDKALEKQFPHKKK